MEFNIADSSEKAIRAVKAKKVPNKKNNLKNISSLLDEILVCLPKEEQTILKDKDEISASEWFNLHKEARDAVCRHLKNDVGKCELKRFEKFLSIASPSNFLSAKKIVFATAAAASLIFSITLVCCQPKRTERCVNFIDSSFFVFLQKQEKDLNIEKINNFAFTKHSDLSTAAAKAVYIVKNESDFHGGDVIKISEDDLFGKIAGKFEVNENFNKDDKMISTVAEAMTDEENKIFTYFKKIINIAKLKQERLSLKMQKKLLNLIDDY